MENNPLEAEVRLIKTLFQAISAAKQSKQTLNILFPESYKEKNLMENV